MKVDPRCPVDMLGYEIITDDRGNARAYIKLKNCSKYPIEALFATVIWHADTDGCLTGEYESRDMKVDARSDFTITASTDEPIYPSSLETRVKKVVFSGNVPVWIADENTVIDVTEQTPAEGLDLKLLKHYAGDDAVAFPVADERVWMCVCTRANPFRRKSCLRCGRVRDEVLSEYTLDALKQKPAPDKKPLKITLPIDPDYNAKKALPDGMIRQRRLLVRRTVTMLTVALCLALMAYISGWRLF